jgi:dephospho-CoA kinase
MLNVGLTGNIASGKSTVAGCFADWGATVIDADELARDAQRPGTPALAAIIEQFGRGVLRPDGALDRDALRSVVMRDADALAALNAIVHPAVRQHRSELVTRAVERGDLILVNDIPLLFEALDPSVFDLVVLVDAPPEVRRERIMAQRGLNGDEADRMIAAQLPPGDKRRRSDIVVDNGGTIEQLEGAAWDAWCSIRERAAAAEEANGPLLAVTAGPEAAVRDMAGTCARYADGGLAVHLACVTARAAQLAPAREALGLAGATALELSLGAVGRDAPAGPRAITALIRRIAPEVIVMGGGSDEGIVHDWVRQAWREAGSTATLFFAADPTASSLAACLDVRPWREHKRTALAAYGATAPSPQSAAPPGGSSLERECFVAEPPRESVASGLFVRGVRPS